jgi:hypothetical protein
LEALAALGDDPLPMQMFEEPVVLTVPASVPIKMLLEPDVNKDPVLNPSAVLNDPVVTARPIELLPNAVLP